MDKLLWFAVRCAITIAFALSASSLCNDPSMQTTDFPFGFFLLGLVGGSIISFRNLGKAFAKDRERNELKKWSRASWFSNPFSGYSQFTHMCGNVFIAMGLFGLVQSCLENRPSMMNLFPLSFGWSMLISNTLFHTLVLEKYKSQHTDCFPQS